MNFFMKPARANQSVEASIVHTSLYRKRAGQQRLQNPIAYSRRKYRKFVQETPYRVELFPYCDADQTFREKSTSLKSECRCSLGKQGKYFQVQWGKQNHRPDARQHRTEKITFDNEHASTRRASTASAGTANTLRMGSLSTQNPCQVVAGRQTTFPACSIR